MAHKDTKPKWSRPAQSLHPHRMGDATPDLIYHALGRAVSNWEGVQAATGSMFVSLQIRAPDNTETLRKINTFSEVLNVHERAKILKNEFLSFLNFTKITGNAKASLKADFKDLMSSYRGWAERRNDLAHGYVMKSAAEDFAEPDEECRIEECWHLTPSCARDSKWGIQEPYLDRPGEPLYVYTSDDINLFADNFQDLDNNLEFFSDILSKYK